MEVKKVAAMALIWACRRKKCVLPDDAFENVTGIKESLWKMEKNIMKEKVGQKIKEEVKTNHDIEENKEALEWVPTKTVGNSLNLEFPLNFQFRRLTL